MRGRLSRHHGHDLLGAQGQYQGLEHQGADPATQVLSSILTVVYHALLLEDRKPHALTREPKGARKDVLLCPSRALRQNDRLLQSAVTPV